MHPDSHFDTTRGRRRAPYLHTDLRILWPHVHLSMALAQRRLTQRKVGLCPLSFPLSVESEVVWEERRASVCCPEIQPAIDLCISSVCSRYGISRTASRHPFRPLVVQLFNDQRLAPNSYRDFLLF